jgi:hypothetical protein
MGITAPLERNVQPRQLSWFGRRSEHADMLVLTDTKMLEPLAMRWSAAIGTA